MQGLFGFYTGFIVELRCLPSCFLFYLLFLVTSYFASFCFISSVSRIFRPTLFHCHELQYMAALWLKYSRHVRHSLNWVKNISPSFNQDMKSFPSLRLSPLYSWHRHRVLMWQKASSRAQCRYKLSFSTDSFTALIIQAFNKPQRP